MHAIHFVIIPSTSMGTLVPLGMMVTFPKAFCPTVSIFYAVLFLAPVPIKTLFLFHYPQDTFAFLTPLSLLACLFFFAFYMWIVILSVLSFPRHTNSSDESRASSVLSVPSSAGALSVLGHTLETHKGLMLLLFVISGIFFLLKYCMERAQKTETDGVRVIFEPSRKR